MPKNIAKEKNRSELTDSEIMYRAHPYVSPTFLTAQKRIFLRVYFRFSFT